MGELIRSCEDYFRWARLPLSDCFVVTEGECLELLEQFYSLSEP